MHYIYDCITQNVAEVRGTTIIAAFALTRAPHKISGSFLFLSLSQANCF